MAATASTAQTGKANFIVTVAALTVLGVIGGGLVGKLIVARLKTDVPASPAATAAERPAPYAGDVVVRELPAIVTNLASPSDTRIRLQVALVFAKRAVEAPDVMVARIGDDIMAFLKTLSIGEIQGASGLQALREDLNERAAVRSEGKVREVIIENLVVQ